MKEVGSNMNKRKLKGVVSSDKMDKTVIVTVTRLKKDSRYLKYHKVSKRFSAHDEGNEYRVGDKVIIEESKPFSKNKKWRVIGSVQKSKYNKE